MQVLISIANVLFGFLKFVLGAAILAVPLFTLKKPENTYKKFILLLSLAAIGILILHAGISTATNLGTLASYGGLDLTTVFTMLGGLVGTVFGILLVFVFPFIASVGKTEKPWFAFLLVLPVFQCILAAILNATGAALVVASGLGAVVQVLVIPVLILAAVWYLTGKKRVLSLVLVIVTAVMFVLCLILSTAAVSTYYETLGMATANPLQAISSSSMFFTAPQRFLFLLLISMGLRAFITAPKPVPPVPQYPQYPQNPQF